MEILLNERGALVFIVRNWISKEVSFEIFNQLYDVIPWIPGSEIPVNMRGIWQPQPRDLFAMGDNVGSQQRYSGTGQYIHPWLPTVLGIRDRIVSELSDNGKINSPLANYNTCLCTKYADGSKYIGWHPDKEMSKSNNNVVGVSFGASRDLYFRDKDDHKRVFKTTLHSGDIYVMFGATNSLFEHSLPKRAVRDSVEGLSEYDKLAAARKRARIVLTFRLLDD